MSDFYIPGQFSKNNNQPQTSEVVSNNYYVPGKPRDPPPPVIVPITNDFYVPGQIQKKEKDFPSLGNVIPQQTTLSWAEKVKKQKEEVKEISEKKKGLTLVSKPKDYFDLKPIPVYQTIDFKRFLKSNFDELVEIFEGLMNVSDIFLDKLEDKNGFKNFAHFIYQTYYSK